MIPFSILAPDLERSHARLLKAMVTQVGLTHFPPMQTWPEVQDNDARHVLSIGKAALDIWHDFNMILVGSHHGSVFQHHDARGELYTIMVLEHPGTLMQLSTTGHEAKRAMMDDLRAWKGLLGDERLARGMVVGVADEHRMVSCAPCRKKKESTIRPATHWEPRLDGIGLCDDHWRKRANIKKRPVKRVEKSSREAQIAGQLEGFVEDGRVKGKMRVMVAKR